jgi:IS5 family transposase
MLRTVNDQPTLWESILPAECLRLPAELAQVDALLDDPVFSRRSCRSSTR